MANRLIEEDSFGRKTVTTRDRLFMAALLPVAILGGVLLGSEDQLMRRTPPTTAEYLRQLSINGIETAGTDFFNRRYSPSRLGKPISAIDTTYDYDFSELDRAFTKLSHVDRRVALRAIFERATAGARSKTEAQLKLLRFLQEASYHSIWLQPMDRDRQAVFDPLVLLELGEMRCGNVARLAADLYDAAGYRTRVIQAGEHVSAEVFYEGGWHFFEADMFGGGQTIRSEDGRIPSLAELSAEPYRIDKLPSTRESAIYNDTDVGRLSSKAYPSYYFFSEQSYAGLPPQIYLKTATLEQAAASKWYGWNYYETLNNPDLKLGNFAPFYEPGAPRFRTVEVQSRRATISWEPSEDKDGDLLGYRVFVSRHSRGWDYPTFSGDASAKRYWRSGGWKPAMYDALFRVIPADVARIVTKNPSVSIDLPQGESRYVSVMPFDQHGEAVGRELYLTSEELRIDGDDIKTAATEKEAETRLPAP